jgi:phytoene synthase
MNRNRMTLEESYAFCRRMCRHTGSSFHAGFRLLPAPKRRATEALYAFLRFTDDLIDGPAPQRPRREALAAWRGDLHAALGDGSAPWFPGDGTAASILPALGDAVRTFDIPHQHLFAVLDGVEMDLNGQVYETFSELRLYCERVGSAVGLACIHIWGFRGDQRIAYSAATSAGIALQLTNILRDLKEDARAGRVYLPNEDLRACGYRADQLRAGVANDGFDRLMSLQIARAESFYLEAAELLDWLEPPGRRVFGLMVATYGTLLRAIASRPAAVLERRVRLGVVKRLRLLARWSLLPPRKASLR